RCNKGLRYNLRRTSRGSQRTLTGRDESAGERVGSTEYGETIALNPAQSCPDALLSKNRVFAQAAAHECRRLRLLPLQMPRLKQRLRFFLRRPEARAVLPWSRGPDRRVHPQ